MKVNNFLKIFFLSLLFKILFGVFLPISTDEAYYWFWGQHPQLSYYDHPAMVAWLFYLGSKFDVLFSHATLQIARIPSIILGHASLYFWYLILKKHLSEHQLIFWLIFAMLSPLWGFGSIIVTPDVPLIFFWSLSIYFFIQISEFSETGAATPWLYAMLGASLGLGFCSKYHIVLFLPAALIYIFVEKKWRILKPSGIFICLLTGLIFSSPVLIWNFQNNFLSFRFQLEHGLATDSSWRLRWPVEYILGQFFLLFPSVFLAARKLPKIDRLKILFYFGWFPLVFFLVTSLKSKVEANWPIAAYPALTSLGFYVLRNSKSLGITMAIWFFAWILVLGQVLIPWLPVEERELKTYELKKFDPLIAVYENAPAGVFASSYQMAAMISYKSRFAAPLIYKAVGMSRIDYFDFQKESTPVQRSFKIICEVGQLLSNQLQKLGYHEVIETKITNEFRLVEVSRD